MKEVIHVCFGTDDAYSKYTAAVLSSVLCNASLDEKYHFYILSSNLSDINKNNISRLKGDDDCNIDFIHVDYGKLEKFSAIKTHPHLNLSIYNRLFIPLLLPEVEKVIYIDSDVVIVQNLKELNSIEMGEYYFAGVEDPFSHKHSQTLGYKDYPYINSGVMVINCKRLRKVDYLNTLLNSVETIQIEAIPIEAGDQDIINYCFHKNIKRIPQKWNSFLAFNYKRYNMIEPNNTDYLEAKNYPAIVHFVGPDKPWNRNCVHPYRNVFLSYFNKLDWTEKNDLKKENSFKETPYMEQNYISCKNILKKILSLVKKKIASDECILKKLKEEIYFQSQVSSLHKDVFEKYKNINTGKKIVLLATGPSLEKYIPIEGAIHVGVNKAFVYNKCDFNYLFVQDYQGAKFYFEDIIEYKKKNKDLEFFCGITGYLPNDEWLIPESVALKAEAKRYYNLYSPDEKVFGEDFTYDILNYPLKCFGSVTFSAMQFILYTNPSQIYLVGCDNTQSGYAKNIAKDGNKLNVDKGIDGWKKLQIFAEKYYPETEIISINPVGLKGIFKDEYTGEKIVKTISSEKELLPAFPENNNLVVLSADNNYALYLGVCIYSIIKNTKESINYDIVILETDIEYSYKQSISQLCVLNENVSIRFFNLQKFEKKLEVLKNKIHAYFTVATYYRMFCAEIFCNYDRMLYLDCDLVVLKDFSFLLSEPFDSNLVIAVPDLTAQGIAYCPDEVCYNNSSYPCSKYFKDDLEIFDYQSYFQAGVIVFNLKELRDFDFNEKCISKLKNLDKPRWVDQCILNSVLYGHIKHVHLKWNFPYHLNFVENKWQLDSYEMVNPGKFQQIEECNNNLPSILHVTSSRKPWAYPETKFADLWWNYARMTPFYDEIVKRNLQHKPSGDTVTLEKPKSSLYRLAAYCYQKFFYKFSLFIKLKTFIKSDTKKKLLADKFKLLFKGKKIFGKEVIARERSATLCKYKILEITVYKSEIKDYYQYRHFLGICLYKNFRHQDFIHEQSAQLESKIHEQSAQLESKMRAIVAEESSRALSVYNLHQKVFPKYKNIHQGQDVVLVATGPSLNDYVPIEGAVHIGVNKAFLFDKVKFDYLFIQDYSAPTRDYLDDFVNYKHSLCNFIGILDKNFPKRCVIPEKYSLFNNVERYYLEASSHKQSFIYDIASQGLGDSESVVFAAMQFILWTNPKRIYLVGCDTSDSGYYTGDTANYLNVNTVFDGWIRLKDFINIYYPDIEIISINPVGLKGVFTSQYTESFDSKMNDSSVLNNTEILETFILNDTTVESEHIGCYSVMNNLHTLCKKNNLHIIGTLKNYESISLYQNEFDRAKVVILNGEGTLHHNAGEKFLKLAYEAKQKGKKVFLINTIWQENSITKKFLDCFDLISVREQLSLSSIATDGRNDAYLVPDLIFYSENKFTYTQTSNEICVSDCVLYDKARALYDFSVNKNYDFYFVGKYIYDKFEEDSKCLFDSEEILTRYSFALTGRFHVFCLGIKYGIPVLVTPSNTYKIEGLMKDVGIGDLYLVNNLDNLQESVSAFMSKNHDDYKEKCSQYVALATKKLDELFSLIYQISR